MELKDFRYFNIRYNAKFTTGDKSSIGPVFINNLAKINKSKISDILSDYDFKFVQKKNFFNTYVFCFDLYNNKLLFIALKPSEKKGEAKSYQVEYINEEFLKKYETENTDMYLNLDRVGTQIHEINKVYIYKNITLAYTYYTKNYHLRIVFNKNMFGYPALTKTRAFKLRTIINKI
jgi:hypothetical protein